MKLYMTLESYINFVQLKKYQSYLVLTSLKLQMKLYFKELSNFVYDFDLYNVCI